MAESSTPTRSQGREASEHYSPLWSANLKLPRDRRVRGELRPGGGGLNLDDSRRGRPWGQGPASSL